MSRYRRQIGRSDPERETSGLAGWMYTDLLLGLAVVFLGSIGVVLIGASTDEDFTGEQTSEEDPALQVEEDRESTTTTDPEPPAKETEICPVLYLPPDDPEDAFKITIPGKLSLGNLASTFRSEMGRRISAENRRLPAGVPLFNFNNLNIALALIYYGPDGENDKEIAREAFDNLVANYPRQFGGAVLRPGLITSGGTRVSIEIFLLTERPCTVGS